MATYQLHCFAQSGNSYKAALMLNLIGADWEPVFVDYFVKTQTRTPEWREALNEMGEVPVLVHDGRHFSQSGAILTYLSEKSGQFGPRNENERYEVLRWLLYDNHKFTSYFATYRFMSGLMKSGDPAVLNFLKSRITTSLAVVDKHLAGQPFIVGDRPTIADLSLCGYLYYPVEEHGFDFAVDYPAIAAWLERIRALPNWEHPYTLMPGHPLP
jgi:glutathione S-transferase